MAEELVPRAAVALIGGDGNKTNAEVAAAWRAAGIDATAIQAADAVERLESGELAIGRVDIRPSLDGVEPGLLELVELRCRGVVVLNRAAALLAAHDKLRTSRLLARAAVRHPPGRQVEPGELGSVSVLPVVVKPRFGSWGSDVYRCGSSSELAETQAEIAGRPWFRRQGAFVQELVPARGYDLRVLVAQGQVIGAASRIPQPGEWRTNRALGAKVVPAVPSPVASGLAFAAVAALGLDFAGVDLLPVVDSVGWTVLEVNGAVEFDDTYSQPGRDVYRDLAIALGVAQSTNERSTSCAAGSPTRARRS